MVFRLLAFVSALLLFAAIFAPVSLLVHPLLQAAPGVSIAGASGSIWNATLRSVSVDDVQLGDLNVRLSPLSLIGGRPEAEIVSEGPLRSARLRPDGRSARLEEVSIETELAALSRRAPPGVQLKVVRGAARLAPSGCLEASGAITLTDTSGRLPGAITGPLACLNGTLLADVGLEGQVAQGRLALARSPEGGLSITAQSEDPALAAALAGLGF
jgi:hypothetical protein